MAEEQMKTIADLNVKVYRLAEERDEARRYLAIAEKQRDDLAGTVAGVVYALRLNALGGIVNQCEHLKDELDELRTERAQLRADVERIGRERDDMARANAELQPLASIANEVIAYRRRVGPLGFQLEKLDDYLSKAGLPLDAPNNEQAHK